MDPKKPNETPTSATATPTTATAPAKAAPSSQRRRQLQQQHQQEGSSVLTPSSVTPTPSVGDLTSLGDVPSSSTLVGGSSQVTPPLSRVGTTRTLLRGGSGNLQPGTSASGNHDMTSSSAAAGDNCSLCGPLGQALVAAASLNRKSLVPGGHQQKGRASGLGALDGSVVGMLPISPMGNNPPASTGSFPVPPPLQAPQSTSTPQAIHQLTQSVASVYESLTHLTAYTTQPLRPYSPLVFTSNRDPITDAPTVLSVAGNTIDSNFIINAKDFGLLLPEQSKILDELVKEGKRRSDELTIEDIITRVISAVKGGGADLIELVRAQHGEDGKKAAPHSPEDLLPPSSAASLLNANNTTTKAAAGLGGLPTVTFEGKRRRFAAAVRSHIDAHLAHYGILKSHGTSLIHLFEQMAPQLLLSSEDLLAADATSILIALSEEEVNAFVAAADDFAQRVSSIPPPVSRDDHCVVGVMDLYLEVTDMGTATAHQSALAQHQKQQQLLHQQQHLRFTSSSAPPVMHSTPYSTPLSRVNSSVVPSAPSSGTYKADTPTGPSPNTTEVPALAATTTSVTPAKAVPAGRRRGGAAARAQDGVTGGVPIPLAPSNQSKMASPSVSNDFASPTRHESFMSHGGGSSVFNTPNSAPPASQESVPNAASTANLLEPSSSWLCSAVCRYPIPLEDCLLPFSKATGTPWKLPADLRQLLANLEDEEITDGIQGHTNSERVLQRLEQRIAIEEQIRLIEGLLLPRTVHLSGDRKHRELSTVAALSANFQLQGWVDIKPTAFALHSVTVAGSAPATTAIGVGVGAMELGGSVSLSNPSLSPVAAFGSSYHSFSHTIHSIPGGGVAAAGSASSPYPCGPSPSNLATADAVTMIGTSISHVAQTLSESLALSSTTPPPLINETPQTTTIPGGGAGGVPHALQKFAAALSNIGRPLHTVGVSHSHSNAQNTPMISDRPPTSGGSSVFGGGSSSGAQGSGAASLAVKNELAFTAIIASFLKTRSAARVINNVDYAIDRFGATHINVIVSGSFISRSDQLAITHYMRGRAFFVGEEFKYDGFTMLIGEMKRPRGPAAIKYFWERERAFSDNDEGAIAAVQMLNGNFAGTAGCAEEEDDGEESLLPDRNQLALATRQFATIPQVGSNYDLADASASQINGFPLPALPKSVLMAESAGSDSMTNTNTVTNFNNSNPLGMTMGSAASGPTSAARQQQQLQLNINLLPRPPKHRLSQIRGVIPIAASHLTPALFESTNSGLVHANTVINFESYSFVETILIELSSEMWESTPDGRIQLDWAIDRFLKDHIARLLRGKAAPRIRLILFGVPRRGVIADAAPPTTDSANYSPNFEAVRRGRSNSQVAFDGTPRFGSTDTFGNSAGLPPHLNLANGVPKSPLERQVTMDSMGPETPFNPQASQQTEGFVDEASLNDTQQMPNTTAQDSANARRSVVGGGVFYSMWFGTNVPVDYRYNGSQDVNGDLRQPDAALSQIPEKAKQLCNELLRALRGASSATIATGGASASTFPVLPESNDSFTARKALLSSPTLAGQQRATVTSFEALDTQQTQATDASSSPNGKRAGPSATAVPTVSDAKLFLPSKYSNLLEAVNLCLDFYDQHNLDRALKHTGQMITVISAGKGLFSVRHKLAQVTATRFLDIGVMSCKLVCIGRPPLHLTPLFEFSGSDASLREHNHYISFEKDKVYYEQPQWLSVTYYLRTSSDLQIVQKAELSSRQLQSSSTGAGQAGSQSGGPGLAAGTGGGATQPSTAASGTLNNSTNTGFMLTTKGLWDAINRVQLHGVRVLAKTMYLQAKHESGGGGGGGVQISSAGGATGTTTSDGASQILGVAAPTVPGDDTALPTVAFSIAASSVADKKPPGNPPRSSTAAHSALSKTSKLPATSYFLRSQHLNAIIRRRLGHPVTGGLGIRPNQQPIHLLEVVLARLTRKVPKSSPESESTKDHPHHQKTTTQQGGANAVGSRAQRRSNGASSRAVYGRPKVDAMLPSASYSAFYGQSREDITAPPAGLSSVLQVQLSGNKAASLDLDGGLAAQLQLQQRDTAATTLPASQLAMAPASSFAAGHTPFDNTPNSFITYRLLHKARKSVASSSYHAAASLPVVSGTGATSLVTAPIAVEANRAYAGGRVVGGGGGGAPNYLNLASKTYIIVSVTTTVPDLERRLSLQSAGQSATTPISTPPLGPKGVASNSARGLPTGRSVRFENSSLLGAAPPSASALTQQPISVGPLSQRVLPSASTFYALMSSTKAKEFRDTYQTCGSAKTALDLVGASHQARSITVSSAANSFAGPLRSGMTSPSGFPISVDSLPSSVPNRQGRLSFGKAGVLLPPATTSVFTVTDTRSPATGSVVAPIDALQNANGPSPKWKFTTEQVPDKAADLASLPIFSPHQQHLNNNPQLQSISSLPEVTSARGRALQYLQVASGGNKKSTQVGGGVRRTMLTQRLGSSPQLFNALRGLAESPSALETDRSQAVRLLTSVLAPSQRRSAHPMSQNITAGPAISRSPSLCSGTPYIQAHNESIEALPLLALPIATGVSASTTQALSVTAAGLSRMGPSMHKFSSISPNKLLSYNERVRANFRASRIATEDNIARSFANDTFTASVPISAPQLSPHQPNTTNTFGPTTTTVLVTVKATWFEVTFDDEAWVDYVAAARDLEKAQQLEVMREAEEQLRARDQANFHFSSSTGRSVSPANSVQYTNIGDLPPKWIQFTPPYESDGRTTAWLLAGAQDSSVGSVRVGTSAASSTTSAQGLRTIRSADTISSAPPPHPATAGISGVRWASADDTANPTAGTNGSQKAPSPPQLSTGTVKNSSFPNYPYSFASANSTASNTPRLQSASPHSDLLSIAASAAAGSFVDDDGPLEFHHLGHDLLDIDIQGEAGEGSHQSRSKNRRKRDQKHLDKAKKKEKQRSSSTNSKKSKRDTKGVKGKEADAAASGADVETPIIRPQIVPRLCLELRLETVVKTVALTSTPRGTINSLASTTVNNNATNNSMFHSVGSIEGIGPGSYHAFTRDDLLNYTQATAVHGVASHSATFSPNRHHTDGVPNSVSSQLPSSSKMPRANSSFLQSPPSASFGAGKGRSMVAGHEAQRVGAANSIAPSVVATWDTNVLASEQNWTDLLESFSVNLLKGSGGTQRNNKTGGNDGRANPRNASTTSNRLMMSSATTASDAGAAATVAAAHAGMAIASVTDGTKVLEEDMLKGYCNGSLKRTRTGGIQLPSTATPSLANSLTSPTSRSPASPTSIASKKESPFIANIGFIFGKPPLLQPHDEQSTKTSSTTQGRALRETSIQNSEVTSSGRAQQVSTDELPLTGVHGAPVTVNNSFSSCDPGMDLPQRAATDMPSTRPFEINSASGSFAYASGQFPPIGPPRRSNSKNLRRHSAPYNSGGSDEPTAGPTVPPQKDQQSSSFDAKEALTRFLSHRIVEGGTCLRLFVAPSVPEYVGVSPPETVEFTLSEKVIQMVALNPSRTGAADSLLPTGLDPPIPSKNTSSEVAKRNNSQATSKDAIDEQLSYTELTGTGFSPRVTSSNKLSPRLSNTNRTSLSGSIALLKASSTNSAGNNPAATETVLYHRLHVLFDSPRTVAIIRPCFAMLFVPRPVKPYGAAPSTDTILFDWIQRMRWLRMTTRQQQIKALKIHQANANAIAAPSFGASRSPLVAHSSSNLVDASIFLDARRPTAAADDFFETPQPATKGPTKDPLVVPPPLASLITPPKAAIHPDERRRQKKELRRKKREEKAERRIVRRRQKQAEKSASGARALKIAGRAEAIRSMLPEWIFAMRWGHTHPLLVAHKGGALMPPSAVIYSSHTDLCAAFLKVCGALTSVRSSERSVAAPFTLKASSKTQGGLLCPTSDPAQPLSTANSALATANSLMSPPIAEALQCTAVQMSESRVNLTDIILALVDHGDPDTVGTMHYLFSRMDTYKTNPLSFVSALSAMPHILPGTESAVNLAAVPTINIVARYINLISQLLWGPLLRCPLLPVVQFSPPQMPSMSLSTFPATGKNNALSPNAPIVTFAPYASAAASVTVPHAATTAPGSAEQQLAQQLHNSNHPSMSTSLASPILPRVGSSQMLSVARSSHHWAEASHTALMPALVVTAAEHSYSQATNNKSVSAHPTFTSDQLASLVRYFAPSNNTLLDTFYGPDRAEYGGGGTASRQFCGATSPPAKPSRSHSSPFAYHCHAVPLSLFVKEQLIAQCIQEHGTLAIRRRIAGVGSSHRYYKEHEALRQRLHSAVRDAKPQVLANGRAGGAAATMDAFGCLDRSNVVKKIEELIRIATSHEHHHRATKMADVTPSVAGSPISKMSAVETSFSSPSSPVSLVSVHRGRPRSATIDGDAAGGSDPTTLPTCASTVGLEEDAILSWVVTECRGFLQFFVPLDETVFKNIDHDPSHALLKVCATRSELKTTLQTLMREFIMQRLHQGYQMVAARGDGLEAVLSTNHQLHHLSLLYCTNDGNELGALQPPVMVVESPTTQATASPNSPAFPTTQSSGGSSSQQQQLDVASLITAIPLYIVVRRKCHKGVYEVPKDQVFAYEFHRFNKLRQQLEMRSASFIAHVGPESAFNWPALDEAVVNPKLLRRVGVEEIYTTANNVIVAPPAAAPKSQSLATGDSNTTELNKDSLLTVMPQPKLTIVVRIPQQLAWGPKERRVRFALAPRYVLPEDRLPPTTPLSWAAFNSFIDSKFSKRLIPQISELPPTALLWKEDNRAIRTNDPDRFARFIQRMRRRAAVRALVESETVVGMMSNGGGAGRGTERYMDQQATEVDDPDVSGSCPIGPSMGILRASTTTEGPSVIPMNNILGSPTVAFSAEHNTLLGASKHSSTIKSPSSPLTSSAPVPIPHIHNHDSGDNVDEDADDDERNRNGDEAEMRGDDGYDSPEIPQSYESPTRHHLLGHMHPNNISLSQNLSQDNGRCTFPNGYGLPMRTRGLCDGSATFLREDVSSEDDDEQAIGENRAVDKGADFDGGEDGSQFPVSPTDVISSSSSSFEEGIIESLIASRDLDPKDGSDATAPISGQATSFPTVESRSRSSAHSFPTVTAENDGDAQLAGSNMFTHQDTLLTATPQRSSKQRRATNGKPATAPKTAPSDADAALGLYYSNEEPLTSLRLVQEEGYAFVHHDVSSGSLLANYNGMPRADRKMTAEVHVSQYYNTSCFFTLEVSWLVASSSLIADWTRALSQNAMRVGLDAYLIPCVADGFDPLSAMSTIYEPPTLLHFRVMLGVLCADAPALTPTVCSQLTGKSKGKGSDQPQAVLPVRHYRRYRPSIATINRACRLLHTSGAFVIHVRPDCSLHWSSNPIVDVPLPQVSKEGEVFNECVRVADMLAQLLASLFDDAMAVIAEREALAGEEEASRMWGE